MTPNDKQPVLRLYGELLSELDTLLQRNAELIKRNEIIDDVNRCHLKRIAELEALVRQRDKDIESKICSCVKGEVVADGNYRQVLRELIEACQEVVKLRVQITIASNALTVNEECPRPKR